jgi:hypothetical protein
MSPPEVWGPAIWTLFHTLIEKMNPNTYSYVIGSMFTIIVKICKFLPCPECSTDASNFLATIKLSNYKTKNEFKNMFYLFHNFVNAKKRKPLYNYADLRKYGNLNLIFVINNFIRKYNTKGNMKFLTESFQRKFVVKDLLLWFKSVSREFIQPDMIYSPQPIIQQQPAIEELIIEEQLIVEKQVVIKELPIIEELLVIEQTIVEEQISKEDSIFNEEPVIKKQLSTEVIEGLTEKNIITNEIILQEINISNNIVAK